MLGIAFHSHVQLTSEDINENVKFSLISNNIIVDEEGFIKVLNVLFIQLKKKD
jgi:hypothetical protein